MHRMSVGKKSPPQMDVKDVQDGSYTKGVVMASVIVGVLRDGVEVGDCVLLGMIAFFGPKPGLAFVIQFPSPKILEGDTVPAAASKSDFESADAERDLEGLSKIWLVNSRESTGCSFLLISVIFTAVSPLAYSRVY